MDKGSMCQSRIENEPDFRYRYTSATRVSSEPSSVYRKNLKAA